MNENDEVEETAAGARISKRDLVRLVAKRAGVTIATTEKVYEALLAEVIAHTRAGRQVTFTGFGRFYPQVHKGHHAQFGAKDQGRLPDYDVLKFGASRAVGNFLALDDETAQATRVPGTTLILGEASDDAEFDEGDAR